MIKNIMEIFYFFAKTHGLPPKFTIVFRFEDPALAAQAKELFAKSTTNITHYYGDDMMPKAVLKVTGVPIEFVYRVTKVEEGVV